MFKMSHFTSALTASLAISGATLAHAGTLTDGQIFSQFNAVIFNNFSNTADVEGLSIVGGNLTGGASFDIKPGSAGASSYSALTVYGNATSGGSYNIGSGGGVTVAGNNTDSFNLNGGANAYVGGTNSGNLALSKAGSVTVVGANSGTLTLNGGGSAYVGGNSGGISAGGVTALSINGNTSNNVNLNGGGSVLLNGSNNGTISLSGGSVSYTAQKGNMNLNGGATATKVASLSLTPPASTLSSFATTFQTPLTTLSTQLSVLAANSTASAAGNAISFNAKPNAGIAVFDIAASFLTANAAVTFNLNGDSSVIVNVVDSCVSGNCTFSIPSGLNFINPTSYASNVLWNFVNATSLTFTGEFGGSVLAPYAAVTNNSPIDGTLVAASYAGNGELHSYAFNGAFPGGDPTSVPEPAGMALIGTGLIGLAVVRRRATQPKARPAARFR